jgi:hypothetical protein
LCFVASAALAATAASRADAGPLAPEVCANVRAEVAELEGKGVRAAMAKGAGTAKSLSAEQLARIRRLLDLDAQVIFRCASDRPYVALRDEPPEDKDVTEPEPGTASAVPAAAAAAGVATKAKPPAKAVPGVARPAAQKAAPKPAVDAAAAAAAPAAVATPGAAAPAAPTAATPAAAKAKARPKPKANDAYVPPPTGDMNGTPLNLQVPVPRQN